MNFFKCLANECYWEKEREKAREKKNVFYSILKQRGGSVAEWLACWTQAQEGSGSNRIRDAVE